MPTPPPDVRVAAIAERVLDGGLVHAEAWLVIDERTGRAARALAERGARVTVWHRTAGPWTATPEAGPPHGAVQAVLLRQPRAREALAYAAERAAAVVAPGGVLLLVGANDEGIKSAPRHLAPFWQAAETLDTKHKARAFRLVRTDATARGDTGAFLEPVRLDLPGGPVDLMAAPGVFAGGGLDPASAMLLEALSAVPAPTAPVLDFACGIGVLTAGVRQAWPEAEVHALDADALATAAFSAGLSGVPVATGDGWAALADLPVPEGGYGLIVSNPPLHRTGRDLDLSVLHALCRGAADRLARGGRLVLVTQRQRAIARALDDAVGRPDVLAEDGRFRVWSVAKGR